MSFLTPLYLLGLLAVGLPILFHLIRRTPRGRQDFSSVMFLEPSPPRITRRSRIEHWLLLCLRVLAICLLAFAFARPFFRQQASADAAAGDGRFVAVLLDASASMRREGLWDEALAEIEQIVEDAAPDDCVALYTFDDRPRRIFTWRAWSSLDPAQRPAALRNAADDLQPGWRGTDLGSALVLAADEIEDAAGRETGRIAREIVVVSDVQAGCRTDALNAYSWPETAAVRLVEVGRELPPTNAGLHAVAASPDDEPVQRVRVTNAADSTRESFQIAWVDEFADGADAGAERLRLYVPPGHSRVVRAPEPPSKHTPSRLILTGDDHDFDNTCFIAHQAARVVTIVYLGSDAPDDPAGQRFYLEPLYPSTPERDVRILDWEFESTALPEIDTGVQMVILAEPPRTDRIAPLREYLQGGGLVLLTILAPEDAAVLSELAGVAPAPAEEAEVESYAMLTDIDFDHPLFAPFDDPRFADFTALRFWRHRTLDISAVPQARVLARFDDGDPAIGEIPLGEGRLVFFAAGWNRDDSQLALWTKFAPLMNRLLAYGSGGGRRTAQYVVGDEIPLSAFTAPGNMVRSVRLPTGADHPLPADATSFRETDRPGIYVFESTTEATTTGNVRVAVNLDPAESRTGPLDAELLEAAGVRLWNAANDTIAREAADRQRQLQNVELEKRQKFWRWLIIAALAVLLLETVIAARLAAQRRTAPEA